MHHKRAALSACRRRTLTPVPCWLSRERCAGAGPLPAICRRTGRRRREHRLRNGGRRLAGNRGSLAALRRGRRRREHHRFCPALRRNVHLQELWGFRWCLSCSKARLDGYGGGAQVLDLGARRSLSWIDTEHWLGDQIARLEQPTPTTDAILDVFDGPQDWTADVEATHLRAFLDREIAADQDVADRFRAFLTEVSAGPGSMLCRECGPAHVRRG